MQPVRTLQISLLLAAAFVAAMITGCAQGGDPVMGTWTLNVAKSTYSPTPAPQNGTAMFAAAGQGIHVVIDGVSATGDKVHWEYTAEYDGKDYAVTGNPDADAISLKRINPNTVETTMKKAGAPTLTNTRVVSSDEKTLTVTTTGTNAQGQAVNNIQVFEKNVTTGY